MAITKINQPFTQEMNLGSDILSQKRNLEKVITKHYETLNRKDFYIINKMAHIFADRFAEADPELWCAAYLLVIRDNPKMDFVTDDFLGNLNLSNTTYFLLKKLENLYNAIGSPALTSLFRNIEFQRFKAMYQLTDLDNIKEDLISFTPAIADEPTFKVLLSDYLHELAQYSSYINKSIEENNNYGLFCANNTLRYATFHSLHKNLLIKYDNLVIGIAIIRFNPQEEELSKCTFYIEQFYVLPAYRGLGITELVAKKLFKMQYGCGALDILNENIHARKFWQNVFTKYAYNVTAIPSKVDDELTTYLFYVNIKE